MKKMSDLLSGLNETEKNLVYTGQVSPEFYLLRDIENLSFEEYYKLRKLQLLTLQTEYMETIMHYIYND